jgi:hypothetical protein
MPDWHAGQYKKYVAHYKNLGPEIERDSEAKIQKNPRIAMETCPNSFIKCTNFTKKSHSFPLHNKSLTFLPYN